MYYFNSKQLRVKILPDVSRATYYQFYYVIGIFHDAFTLFTTEKYADL